MPARLVTIITTLALCLLLSSCAAGTPAPSPAITPTLYASAIPTEAPQPTLPTFPADLTVMPTAGYAFRIPADWQMRQAGSIATLEPPATSPQSGMVTLVLNGGDPTKLVIEEFSTSTIASLEDLSSALLTSLEQETLDMQIEAREELVLDGQPALLIRARSAGFGDLEQAVQIRLIASLPAPNRAFVLLGLASPPDAWQADAALLELLQSLRLFAPTAR